jgi:hypothetical protein
VVQIVPIPAVEQAPEPEGRAVTVPDLPSEEGAEGEFLLRSLRRDGKMQHDVRQVHLLARE